MQVIPGLDRGGGAEESLAVIAPFLVAEGVELHVATLTDRRDLVGRLEADGVVTHDVSGPAGALRTASRLRALLEQTRPDIVHSTLFEADVATTLAGTGLGLARLTTWASTPFAPERHDEPGLDHRKLALVRAIDRWSARWSQTEFQAVTPGVAAENARALRIDPARVHVAERARLDPGDVPPEGRRDARRVLGLEPEAPVILCVARHVPQKGLDRLIPEFDIVRAAHRSALLLIAGAEGPITPTLRSLAAGGRGGVELLGHRGDVDVLMTAADVVVSASRCEGAAGAVIEAMSRQRPIVATDVRGLRGVLVDGHNARVVGRDRGALGQALVDLLADDQLSERLGQEARRSFVDRFLPERAASDLISIYRRMART